ncbi:hypothetical protein M0802_011218 [Mischocyttarus mexicanus]|nr:hypothetical protein M0802_011218 [Mischocyttarus mexicanus]
MVSPGIMRSGFYVSGTRASGQRPAHVRHYLIRMRRKRRRVLCLGPYFIETRAGKEQQQQQQQQAGSVYPPLFGPCEEACGHVSPVYRATGKKRTEEGEQEVYVGEFEALVVLLNEAFTHAAGLSLLWDQHFHPAVLANALGSSRGFSILPD